MEEALRIVHNPGSIYFDRFMNALFQQPVHSHLDFTFDVQTVRRHSLRSAVSFWMMGWDW